MNFFNLNQINCCSTLKGRYPLSYILSHRLRKVLAQTLLPGCFPVIMHQNLFYYVKLTCQTPHESCQVINPLFARKDKDKLEKQAEQIESNLYLEISKFITKSVGIEMERALSMTNLQMSNADVKSPQTLT